MEMLKLTASLWQPFFITTVKEIVPKMGKNPIQIIHENPFKGTKFQYRSGYSTKKKSDGGDVIAVAPRISWLWRHGWSGDELIAAWLPD